MWSVIVHGGARKLAAGAESDNIRGVLTALDAAARALEQSSSAIDACEAAVLRLEDDTTFNAGTGAVLNADGETELDAALMDGETLDIGAVGALIGYCNPIHAARALLRDDPVLLVGAGAARAAHANRLQLTRPHHHPSPNGGDTVGAIVRDAAGNFAVGISTGGLAGKPPGRVGDAPLPGCGFYADNGIGAVCLSGDGERITRTLLAAHVMHALESGATAQAAADGALTRLVRVGGQAGVIVMSRTGEAGIAHNTPHFAVAAQTSASAARAQLEN